MVPQNHEIFTLPKFSNRTSDKLYFVAIIAGVLIACYLVYAERMDPAAAILRVRKNRSNSIQTRGQIACINDFWLFLRPLRIVFPQVSAFYKTNR